jgi:hypothetical protein
MKQAIFILIGILFISILNCESTMDLPDKDQNTTLQSARALLGIGNDSDYDRLLEAQKHLTSLAAPEPFRTLLKNINPFRFSLETGIEHDGKTLRFVWFSGEFGAEGNPEEVLARISASLAKSGFTALPQDTSESGFPLYRFTRAGAKTNDEAVIEGPKHFVGTKTERCGGTLTYRVTLNRPIPDMTYDEVLLAFPAFRCQAVDEELANQFSGKLLARTGFGGTWEQYYDWTYVFAFPDNGSAANFFQEIKATLLKKGFAERYMASGTITFMGNTIHDSVFYLGFENETLVSVRVQPHT